MDVRTETASHLGATTHIHAHGRRGDITDHRFEAESDLVHAARQGDPRGFEGLWSLYSPRLYRTALRIVRNPEDAEDALQETFLLAFRNINGFQGRSTCYSWLTRITMNSALVVLRKRSRRREDLFETLPHSDRNMSDDLRDGSPSPEEFCDATQRREVLKDAIKKLPSGLQAALNACVLEESSVKDLATRLSISQAAAKSRLHRARSRVRAIARSQSLQPRLVAQARIHSAGRGMRDA